MNNIFDDETFSPFYSAYFDEKGITPTPEGFNPLVSSKNFVNCSTLRNIVHSLTSISLVFITSSLHVLDVNEDQIQYMIKMTLDMYLAKTKDIFYQVDLLLTFIRDKNVSIDQEKHFKDLKKRIEEFRKNLESDINILEDVMNSTSFETPFRSISGLWSIE